jgi:hypothetical protein
MKIIITESQLKLIKEAVGVPEGILKAGEELFKIVASNLKKINNKDNKHEFHITEEELQISDVTIDFIKITVSVEEIEGYDGKPVIASMGVNNAFRFDKGIMMQVSKVDKVIELEINFIVPKEWEPQDLYETFISDETHNESVMAHEIMHKFHRTKKTKGFVGDIADYQAYSSGKIRFNIPVLDDFMLYSYYIQAAENTVRPTEVASRMIKKGITKDQFKDFIKEDETFKQLKQIQNFTYDYLISSLRKQMDRIDGLIKHIGDDPSKMSVDYKIEFILKIAYVNLVNLKIEIFDNYFYDNAEKFLQSMGGLFGKVSKEKEDVRKKFVNHVVKYENKEMDFFKDECERFNYVATKLMKKISKIYALLPDEKEQTNESILDWELHQKLMEKKYGERPIQKSYNFKK